MTVHLHITLDLDRFHLDGYLPDDPGDYDYVDIRAALADVVTQLSIDCREGPAWTAETDEPAGWWYLSASA